MFKLFVVLKLLFIIVVSAILIRFTISERKKIDNSGELIFEFSKKSYSDWGNVIFYLILLIGSIKSGIFTHWIDYGIQIVFIFVIIYFVIRGLRKNKICENAIVSTDFVIEWTDIKNYEWKESKKKYKILKIDLRTTSNAIMGLKNKKVRLKMLRSEIDIVDGIFKQSLF
ncbi:MAG: hypothetical protein U9N10_01255 [Bacillota bacterium]|nr:hypothetical protein [Bacillota bacterium]